MSYLHSKIQFANPLFEQKAIEAVAMWNDGFDTLDIARQLRVPEDVIYTALPIWRKRAKMVAL